MTTISISRVLKQVVSLYRLRSYTAVLLLLVILLIGGAAIRPLSPPPAVPADAPADEFSSARAMAHLRMIAKRPRPQGSSEHSAVRDYIFQQLSSLGVTPQIQPAAVTHQNTWGEVTVATVENIMARLAGTDSGKSIVLISHYDSVPSSPGASDDGAGVAAMLETLRALRNSPPVKNDVIFLFTDGEEMGLLGARAFVAEYSRTLNVGLVLNFESRGNSGPVIMFETSDGNSGLIDELAQAAPRLIANSLSQEIYKLLPNDTDFSVFKSAGWDGLNFAYISGLKHYHTMLDNLESIDERSLQHHGTYALELSRRLGDIDLGRAKTGNCIYFDLAGVGLVHYSTRWVGPLTVLVCALYIAVLILGIWRGRIGGAGLLRGTALFFSAQIISPIVIALVSLLIGKFNYDYQAFPQGDAYNSQYYLVGYVALALAVVTALYGIWRRKATALDLAMGALFWWLFFTIITGIFLPGGSYLFVWPLLFSLVTILAGVVVRREWRSSFTANLLPLSGALPGVILWSPMIYLISEAFGLALAPIVISLVILVTGLFITHLNQVRLPNDRLLPGILMVVGMISIGAAVIGPPFDPEHPRPNGLFYAVNADSGEAIWASRDRRPDAWTSQFLTDRPKSGPLSDYIPSTYPAYLSNPAPMIEVAAPEISLVGQSTDVEVKTSHFVVKSPRKAPMIFILLEQDTEVISCSINGRAVNGGRWAGRWGIRYLPLPEAGVELTLKTRASSPIKMRVVDLSYDLPAIAKLTSNPRPGEYIPTWFPYSDTTFVSKTYSF